MGPQHVVRELRQRRTRPGIVRSDGLVHAQLERVPSADRSGRGPRPHRLGRGSSQAFGSPTSSRLAGGVGGAFTLTVMSRVFARAPGPNRTLPGDPVICCPAPAVSPSADPGRFSRPAHHAPQATTAVAITVANAAATTHRSASALGRNGNSTAIASHKQTPKVTAAATPVDRPPDSPTHPSPPRSSGAGQPRHCSVPNSHSHVRHGHTVGSCPDHCPVSSAHAIVLT